MSSPSSRSCTGISRTPFTLSSMPIIKAESAEAEV
jgi:hypothetical protein